MTFSYNDYLQSDRWKRLREQAIVRARGKCEFCGEKAQAVHHVKYPKNLSNDSLDNLVVVCKKCHETSHGKREIQNVNIENVQPDKSIDFYGRIITCHKCKDGKAWVPLRQVHAVLSLTPSINNTDLLLGEAIDGEDYIFQINGETGKAEYFLSPEGISIVGIKFGTGDKSRELRRKIVDAAFGKEKQQIQIHNDPLIAALQQLQQSTAIVIKNREDVLDLQKKHDSLEQRISLIEKSAVTDSLNSTVRQRILFHGLNPESDFRGIALKRFLGGYCSKRGLELNVNQPPSIAEGTFMVNQWPNSHIDLCLRELGLINANDAREYF